MKIINDVIVSATEKELYSYWLSRGFDDIYSFTEYMRRMKLTGIVIEQEDTNE